MDGYEKMTGKEGESVNGFGGEMTEDGVWKGRGGGGRRERQNVEGNIEKTEKEGQSIIGCGDEHIEDRLWQRGERMVEYGK